MCKVSALKKTDWEQTDFKLSLVQPDRTRVQTDSKILSASCEFCKLKCCFSCTFCSRAATKERHKSSYCKTKSEIKMCEQCFLCRSIVFCQTCTKCPQCCTKSACRGKTKSVLGNLENLGGRTRGSTIVERRVHPTFPNLTRSPTIISCYVNPHRNLYLLEALHQLTNKNGVGHKPRISGLLQPAFFGPKTKQQMETYTRSEQCQQIPQSRKSSKWRHQK